MKTCLLFLMLLFGTNTSAPQPRYVAQAVRCTFFSEAPIEDISAYSDQGLSALNLNTGEIYFRVSIRSFTFRKRLMQEHFNENYLESHKYPNAEFKGRIQEKLDPAKPGVYPVTVQGDLTLHQVTHPYTVKGEIKVLNGGLSAVAKFPVRLADHDIKIPRIVIRNIAEVVAVTVSASYKPAPSQQ